MNKRLFWILVVHTLLAVSVSSAKRELRCYAAQNYSVCVCVCACVRVCVRVCVGTFTLYLLLYIHQDIQLYVVCRI